MTKHEAMTDLKISLRLWGRKPQKESYEIAIEALEKQIPKRPIGGIDSAGNEYEICCECSAIVEDSEWRASFCPDCGQALDWSDGNA